jgi:hypothetical protein
MPIHAPQPHAYGGFVQATLAAHSTIQLERAMSTVMRLFCEENTPNYTVKK